MILKKEWKVVFLHKINRARKIFIAVPVKKWESSSPYLEMERAKPYLNTFFTGEINIFVKLLYKINSH
jgi:hypothetical protein